MAVISTMSITLATVTTVRLSGLPITKRPCRKKLTAMRTRKKGIVWVSRATLVDVHRTSAMPATMTLHRAHMITVWPKKTSSSSACFAVRTSRVFDIGLTSC